MRRLIIAFLLILCALPCGARVKPGIEVLRENDFKGLRGKRVGLVTNPSGVTSTLENTVDILYTNVRLVALFAPEHGIRGDIQAGLKVESGTDEQTGLPVYSLYGATRSPEPWMLDGIDVMVYDIQDVGCRSYTFISTLGLVMRACAEKGIPLVVLDRPNPLGGLKIEGPVPEEGFYSFVGQYRIPYIYGLTVGELARLINEEGLNRGQKGDGRPLKCKLTVVPMEGWNRSMLFKDTGLPWIAPSPNIPYPESAICYPASGLTGEFYGYLNIGIGYTLPFGLFAAEWIDADLLKMMLDAYDLPGIAWRAIHFRPFSGSGAGKYLHGVQFYIIDYEAAEITLIQFYVMQAIFELFGREPFSASTGRMGMFNKVCGSEYPAREFSRRMKVDDIIGYWTKDEDEFRVLAEKYYLYK